MSHDGSMPVEYLGMYMFDTRAVRRWSLHPPTSLCPEGRGGRGGGRLTAEAVSEAQPVGTPWLDGMQAPPLPGIVISGIGKGKGQRLRRGHAPQGNGDMCAKGPRAARTSQRAAGRKSLVRGRGEPGERTHDATNTPATLPPARRPHTPTPPAHAGSRCTTKYPGLLARTGRWVGFSSTGLRTRVSYGSPSVAPPVGGSAGAVSQARRASGRAPYADEK